MHVLPAQTMNSRSKIVVDPCSRCNADVVQIQHLDWNVTVDFDRRILQCVATYTLSYVKYDILDSPKNEKDEKRNVLILDTNHLIIENVKNEEDGQTLTYQILPVIEGKPHLGRALVIDLLNVTTSSQLQPTKVTVEYRTTEASSALQWLPPEQTASKKYPYMFTQCQAIHGRSLVPCQDIPGVKFTYTVTITTPRWATAVASAVREWEIASDNNKSAPDCNTKTSVWHQKIPISSYLLALAVGELECRDLSPRCAVYSEPSVVDAAAYEFAETETFLQLAEKIVGTPYQWKRYDLLCLPPSFSYGGMENACMTFVTPTLLAGDRSLAGVVAHEIAHSWTGNYVTCATWDDFWLNEGWTVWLERKIAAKIHGEKYLDFEAVGGYQDLQDAVNSMPEQFTSLVLPIGDTDPDDAYSTIAYEKGFNLLLYLERKVGTEKFEKFFEAYIKEFGSRTLSSETFKEFFLGYFARDKIATSAIQDVDWNTWFYKPGLPPTVVDFDRSLSQASERLAQEWLQVDRSNAPIPTLNVQAWSSNQMTCFLDGLISLTSPNQPLKCSTLQSMDALYGFAKSRNAEILLRYCRLAIASEDKSVLPVVTRFITSQGRMKFIRPLYKALYASKMGKEIAVETFLRNKDFYHPIGAKMVASDLLLNLRDHASTKTKKVDYIKVVALISAIAVGISLVLKRRKQR